MEELKIIARIHTDFSSKFGIPRQSNLVKGLTGTIMFEPAFRDINAVKGIECFSHLWLLWIFSENEGRKWSPTVRPPRLGGNRRTGVFATRSPFRPNNIGLSSVRLISVEYTKNNGAVLYVEGADLMDGTPIVDIKPYIPISDCHPDAVGGFSDEHKDDRLSVVIPQEVASDFPKEKISVLKEILAGDPRPSYQKDERIYGMSFCRRNIKFQVKDEVLTVIKIE